MSRKRFAIHRKDATEKALVAEAQALGAQYLPIDGIIDGVLWYRGRSLLVDWKGPKTKVTAAQQQLIDRGWVIHIIRTSEELRALLVGDGTQGRDAEH